MADDYISVVSATELNPLLVDFAVEMCVKIAAEPYSNEYLASKGDADTVGGWAIWVDASGYLNVQLHSTDYTIAGTASICTDVEKHIVVNFDRGVSITVYVDGVLYATLSLVTFPAIASVTNAYAVNIGCYQNVGERGGYLKGYVRQFRYYVSRILTAAEIAANFADPERCYDKEDLFIWLKADEGTGSYLTDSSGNNHPGTLSSGGTWSTLKYVGCLICVDRNKAVWVKEGETTFLAGPMAVFDDKLVVGCGESGGTKPNLVYLDEDTNTDQSTDGETAAFPSEYQSPQFDSGMPDIQKRSRFVMVEYRDRLAYTGGTFNVWYRLDEGMWKKLNQDAAITLGVVDKSVTRNFPFQTDAYYRIDFAIDAEYDLEISRIMVYPELLSKSGTK